MRIYLAGALFTFGEQWFLAELTRCLRVLGHEVWLPQEKQGSTRREIFQLDVQGIDWSQVVVACVDHEDDGTAWECGYAYGKRPVVIFTTDYRATSGEYLSRNIMIWESCDKSIVFPPRTTGADMARMISVALEKLGEKR